MVTFELHQGLIFFFSVLADLGGLLGLFIGCSLISIIEIIYHLTSGVIDCILNLKGSSKVVFFVNKRREQQVSNNDLLHALNMLEKTVNEMDLRNQKKFQEINQKISGYEKELSNLKDKKVTMKVLDLDQ